MAIVKAQFLSRLASSLILWAAALGVVFAGHELGFLAIIAVIGFLALWEFYRMLDHAKLPNFQLTGLLCGVASLTGSFLYYRSVGLAHSYDFEMGVLLFFLMVVFARQMFERTRPSAPLETMAYTLFGLMYVPWLFNFISKIVFVVQGTGHFYVLYLVVVTKFADMGAYVTGMLFGKHLLVPHISPKKTWEGLVGALGFAVLGSWGMMALMPVKLELLHRAHAISLGLLLGFAAIVGDLGESVLKRSTGVKDSGGVLPGIGGVLDLIDSLLFTAPLLFLYLRFVIGAG